MNDSGVMTAQLGGLVIEIEAVVLGAHTFKARSQDVAKVTVMGNPSAPMGAGIVCSPNPIFELDACMAVFRALKDMHGSPIRMKFRADLKPINATGGYAVHLLEVLHII
ncbi:MULTISPECIES: hypothetical protein [Pseudomonas]|uniref:hypothetical protein n=1 Tax=Pseudomonas TaxID=286 RepID=UPI003002ABA7